MEKQDEHGPVLGIPTSQMVYEAGTPRYLCFSSQAVCLDAPLLSLPLFILDNRQDDVQCYPTRDPRLARHW